MQGTRLHTEGLIISFCTTSQKALLHSITQLYCVAKSGIQ